MGLLPLRYEAVLCRAILLHFLEYRLDDGRELRVLQRGFDRRSTLGRDRGLLHGRGLHRASPLLRPSTKSRYPAGFDLGETGGMLSRSLSLAFLSGLVGCSLIENDESEAPSTSPSVERGDVLTRYFDDRTNHPEQTQELEAAFRPLLTDADAQLLLFVLDELIQLRDGTLPIASFQLPEGFYDSLEKFSSLPYFADLTPEGSIGAARQRQVLHYVPQCEYSLEGKRTCLWQSFVYTGVSSAAEFGIGSVLDRLVPGAGDFIHSCVTLGACDVRSLLEVAAGLLLEGSGLAFWIYTVGQLAYDVTARAVSVYDECTAYQGNCECSCSCLSGDNASVRKCAFPPGSSWTTASSYLCLDTSEIGPFSPPLICEGQAPAPTPLP